MPIPSLVELQYISLLLQIVPLHSKSICWILVITFLQCSCMYSQNFPFLLTPANQNIPARTNKSRCLLSEWCIKLLLFSAKPCNRIVTSWQLLMLHPYLTGDCCLSFIMWYDYFFSCSLPTIGHRDNPKNSEESRGSAYLRYHCVSYWVPC